MININYNSKRSTVEFEKDGEHFKKTIDTVDLIHKALNDVVGSWYPILPRGTRFIRETDYAITIGIEFGRRRRDFKHRLDPGGMRTIKGIGCPGGLFVCMLNKLTMSVVNGFLFSLTEEGFSEKAPLLEYPFPNLYEDGRICWGNTLEVMSINTLPSLAAIEGLLEIFFSSIFNNELYNQAFSSKFPKYTDSWGDHAQSAPYQKLVGVDFQDEWLRKTYLFKNINTFLNRN